MITKADITRKRILDKAFRQIYQNGYQATSIDNILKELDVTKGAFYYHFKTKKDMGMAVVKEVIYPRFFKSLIEPLARIDHPKERIIEVIENAFSEITDYELSFGCPINNLVQEMASIDPDFQKLFKSIFDQWKEAIILAFEKGKAKGQVDPDTNTAYLAQFIILSYEGVRAYGKVYQDWNHFYQYLAELEIYLSNK